MKTLHRFRGSFYYFDLLIPGLKSPRAYFNWLRVNYEMFRQVETVKAKPLKLTIEPTNMCHLQCPLCPTGLRINERVFCDLNMDIFKCLIDEVGDYVFFVDLFNWGEPLLSNQIEDFLLILHKRKISTTLSTNLSVKISDERIHKLITSGLNHIIASLDGGSKESYIKYRRGGNFDLVIDNLRRIVEMRDKIGSKTPYITWQYLVFRFNEHELAKAQNIAKDIGVDRIWFQKAYIDEGHYKISDSDRNAIRKWIPSNPLLTFYDPKDAEKHFSVPLKLMKKYRKKRCDWHYASSAINSDGKISPCCALYKKSDDLGFLNQCQESSYMTEINNHSFKEIRNGFAGRCMLPENVACSTCSNGTLMEYAKGINRWIFFTTVAKILYYFIFPLEYFVGKCHKTKKPKLKIKWPD